jgi:hypothetical protein
VVKWNKRLKMSHDSCWDCIILVATKPQALVTKRLSCAGPCHSWGSTERPRSSNQVSPQNTNDGLDHLALTSQLEVLSPPGQQLQLHMHPQPQVRPIL